MDNEKSPIGWIVAGIVGLICWAVYFWALPVWAGWSLAIFAGIMTSVALGAEIKRAGQRYIERTEAKQRAELQKELDDAGG